ncbi:unnamed protein product [Pleuronectes platessa]|uniref:Uncharacterized protein n=1 Tax=Pleuronectes platessa TaxID=8262 RepID=A0A9N7URQ8_PLEPL|nr:unnamed protein product [Pleuronectes platessa]
MFIFVVKPLGTCRGWGSSPSVALLSAPPEAQCAAPGGPHPVAPHGAGGEGTGYAVSGGHSGRLNPCSAPGRSHSPLTSDTQLAKSQHHPMTSTSRRQDLSAAEDSLRDHVIHWPDAHAHREGGTRRFAVSGYGLVPQFLSAVSSVSSSL